MLFFVNESEQETRTGLLKFSPGIFGGLVGPRIWLRGVGSNPTQVGWSGLFFHKTLETLCIQHLHHLSVEGYNQGTCTTILYSGWKLLHLDTKKNFSVFPCFNATYKFPLWCRDLKHYVFFTCWGTGLSLKVYRTKECQQNDCKCNTAMLYCVCSDLGVYCA